MALQTINTGVSANDGLGDPARDAFTKANANFAELYAAAKTANANNGHNATLARQANTGVNVQMRDAKFSYGKTSFPGELYSDPVVAIGYNVDAQLGVADFAGGEKFGNGIFFESDYAVDSQEGGTATSGTTTTQVTISGKSWGLGRFVNWTVYNVTRGLSAQITANTATTLTHAAIAGQTTGDVIQILRRELEMYPAIWDYASGAPRGFRPWMYTFDKGSAENHSAAKVITAATNAADAQLTTSVAHNMIVGAYVKFEGLAGGTWGTALNNRSVRIKSVPSATTFTIENDSTGYGTFVASGTTVCYWEPDITSVYYADKYNGFEIRTPTYRLGSNLPSGQSYSDNMVFRALSGQIDFAPGGADNTFVNVRSSPSGTANFYMYHQGVAALRLGNASVSTTNQTFVGVNMFSNAGAEVQAAAFFQKTNGTWGGMQVGANGGVTDATLVLDAALQPTSTALIKARHMTSPVNTTYALAFYQSDWATLNWFVDGVGNHVPKATAAAAADTNGFQYITKISGAGVTGPTGTPQFLTGNYANAAPMVASHNTSDNTYRISVYINGGWRTATLT